MTKWKDLLRQCAYSPAHTKKIIHHFVRLDVSSVCFKCKANGKWVGNHKRKCHSKLTPIEIASSGGGRWKGPISSPIELPTKVTLDCSLVVASGEWMHFTVDSAQRPLLPTRHEPDQLSHFAANVSLAIYQVHFTRHLFVNLSIKVQLIVRNHSTGKEQI